MMGVSALATTLFLGGYHALPGLGFTEQWLGGWFTLIWFLAKVFFFFFIFIWVRGSLPRLRYDQFMKFGWKVLIPVSLLWILIVATLRTLSLENASRSTTMIVAGVMVALVLSINFGFEQAKAKKRVHEPLDLPEPDFPVPHIPGSSLNVTGGDRG